MPFAMYFGWYIGSYLTGTKYIRSFSHYFVKSMANLIEPFFVLPILIIILYAVRIVLTKNKKDTNIKKISFLIFFVAIFIGFIEAFYNARIT